MISPNAVEKLKDSKQRSVKEIIADIDDAIKRVHGWYPWEDAIIDYELPVHTRNRVANMYINAGWKYVYHHTSSENLERPGLTAFKFSMEPLDKKYVRGMYVVTEKAETSDRGPMMVVGKDDTNE